MIIYLVVITTASVALSLYMRFAEDTGEVDYLRKENHRLTAALLTKEAPPVAASVYHTADPDLSLATERIQAKDKLYTGGQASIF